MPHSHQIYDSDKHFVIDPITRNITNNSSKITIMQYDHNSERFTFEIPRVIEGHDMSLSDVVRVHFINIGSIKTNTNPGVYEVDDVTVSSDDPDTVTFSWLISGASTKYNGSLHFAIRFYCLSDESEIEYSWGTNIYSGINVANSIDNSETIAEDYVDVLEQWKQSLQHHISDDVIHITSEERSEWNDKQDKLIAGDNITIAADGKTISATGGGGGSTVELDTTLSEAGKAADAKAVGDALAGKQDTISDLEAIRSGAAKGATALQSVPSTYRTASEQDTIDSGKVDKVTGKGLSSNDYTAADKAKVDALKPVATSGSYNDLTDKPTIPDAVTEATVSGWGFTKNTGTYSKPTDGIPKMDLSSSVQASLNKADSALQSHQSLAAYRTALAQDVIDSDLGDRIEVIEGKEAGWDAKSDFSGSYNDLTDKPTIPTEVTPLIGATNNLTPTQVYNAVSAGIPVKVQRTDSTFGLISFTAFTVAESLNMIASNMIAYANGVYMLCELFGDKSSNNWGFNVTTLAQKTDIPSALPNPNALTFTGAVTGTYDGSTAKTVNIPSAVTDDHINSLIDTKLGVIENGSY